VFSKSLGALVFTALLATACMLLAGCRGEHKASGVPSKVSVMIYSEYIDPEMLTDFQMKTGYKLQLELYEAQEEMIEKLEANGTEHYDVIIASDVVVKQMIRRGLISKIDTNKIFNRRNIANHFRSPTYDSTGEYSVPYLWGSAGILYRDTSLPPSEVSYSMLFDPDQNKGNFSLLEESRSMLSIALLAKGHDPNTTDPKQVGEAVDLIVEAKHNPHFQSFDGSVSGKDKVLSNVNWAAIVFNGEAMAAIEEDSTLQFAIPTEGSFMWVDAMLLSSRAPNPDGAYAFMSYILDANVGAKLAQYINYASPNSASIQIVDEKFKKNRVINPSQEEIARMSFLRDCGSSANRLYDSAWQSAKNR